MLAAAFIEHLELLCALASAQRSSADAVAPGDTSHLKSTDTAAVASANEVGNSFDAQQMQEHGNHHHHQQQQGVANNQGNDSAAGEASQPVHTVLGTRKSCNLEGLEPSDAMVLAAQAADSKGVVVAGVRRSARHAQVTRVGKPRGRKHCSTPPDAAAVAAVVDVAGANNTAKQADSHHIAPDCDDLDARGGDDKRMETRHQQHQVNEHSQQHDHKDSLGSEGSQCSESRHNPHALQHQSHRKRHHASTKNTARCKRAAACADDATSSLAHGAAAAAIDDVQKYGFISPQARPPPRGFR